MISYPGRLPGDVVVVVRKAKFVLKGAWISFQNAGPCVLNVFGMCHRVVTVCTPTVGPTVCR